MSLPSAEDPVLQQARSRAQAGAWAEVAALLAHHPADARRPEPLLLHAEALIRSGAPQEARERLRAVVPALERTPYRGAHRTSLNLLGAASFAVGALDEAQAAWDRALELAQQDDDALLIARATNNLGAIANLRGAAHDALYLYQLAVPAYQRLGESRGLAETYHNLAMTYREMGALTDADEHERLTIDHARAAHAPRLAVMAQVGRAEVAMRRGDLDVAAATALRAAAAAGALGDTATRTDALRCAGAACTALGRLDEARRALDEALRVGAESHFALMLAESQLASARLSLRLGDVARARQEAVAAVRGFDALGAMRGLEDARGLVAELGAG